MILMNKIIFIDIDGTLVINDTQTIPSSAIKAIRLAREKGHQVYLCTGRSKPEIYESILDIGIDGIIGAAGGFCEVKNDVLFENHFSSEVLKIIIDFLQMNQIPYYLETNDGIFDGGNCYKELQKIIYKEDDTLLLEKLTNDSPHPFLSVMKKSKNKYPENVNKICFLDNKKTTFDHIYNILSSISNVIPCTVPSFGKNSGEILIKNTNKAIAIEKLLKHINIEKYNTVAFGDSYNDIEMFEYCNLSIAMGNACEKLKNIADDVTDDNDKDGIYKSFIKYGFI